MQEHVKLIMHLEKANISFKILLANYVVHHITFMLSSMLFNVIKNKN